TNGAEKAKTSGPVAALLPITIELISVPVSTSRPPPSLTAVLPVVVEVVAGGLEGGWVAPPIRSAWVPAEVACGRLHVGAEVPPPVPPTAVLPKTVELTSVVAPAPAAKIPPPSPFEVLPPTIESVR